MLSRLKKNKRPLNIHYKTHRKMKLSAEEKEANKLARKKQREQEKEARRIESERNQKPVQEITFSIEWKKSQTWGANPNLECFVRFKDGTGETSPTYKASGCGYDKESTVIADGFNQYLKYILWAKMRKDGKGFKGAKKVPYGVHNYTVNRPHFGGGIGMNCYYEIAKFLGGKLERISTGKTFDVYKFTNLK